MKGDKITIFFACDNNYVPMLWSSVNSIYKNKTEKYFYDIKVLHGESVNKTNVKKFEQCFNKENFNIEFVDVTPYILPLSNKLHTRDYYSKTTYYRLFIPNMYKDIDKALYIDSDVILNTDIAKLFNENLDGYLVGAIGDQAVSLCGDFILYVENKIGVSDYSKYFNAGVLLMNLKLLRKVDFEGLFIEMLTKIKFTVAQDQDYLNSICKGNVKFLDDRWNVMPISPDNKERKDAFLIHYNLANKPWFTEDVLYRKSFWHYSIDNPFLEQLVSMKANYNEENARNSRRTTLNLMNLARTEALDKKETLKVKEIINEINKKVNERK